MLSSREHRFHWSKQDRAAAVPFFRMLARRWRPTVRKPDAQAETTSKKTASRKAAAATAKPVWTPWLWVD